MNKRELLNELCKTYNVPVIFIDDSALPIYEAAGHYSVAAAFASGAYLYTKYDTDGTFLSRLVFSRSIVSEFTKQELIAFTLREVAHLDLGHILKVRDKSIRSVNFYDHMEVAADTWAVKNGAEPTALLSMLGKMKARLEKYEKTSPVMIELYSKFGFFQRLGTKMIQLKMSIQYNRRCKNLTKLAKIIEA